MFRSIRKLALFGLLPLAAFGCKKKETCSYDILYLSEGVAFIGYSPADLNAVVLEQYTAGSNFSGLLSKDTIDASGAFFQTDTAYKNMAMNFADGFFEIKLGVDYKITLLNTSRSYTITEIKEGPASCTWTQKEPCSMGAGQARIAPYSCKVNGADYTPYAPYVNQYFLYLSR